MANILEIISHISSITAKEEALQKCAKKIIKLLTPILPKDDDDFHLPKTDLIPATLFEKIEDEFRGRVARTASKEITFLYNEVTKAAKKYEEILSKELLSVIEIAAKEKSSKARKPALSYDIHNQTIWLLGSVNSEVVKKHKLIHPIDRYGKEVKDRLSSKAVEEALQNYKEIALKTQVAIKKILQEASRELSPFALPIIHLASFSNLLKTLYLHIKECSTKNWSINFTYDESTGDKINLEEFFPYWMKKNAAICNSLEFDNACLLTGHNMSGKSTLIRSVASTTLLAASGFMFPAKKVTIAKEIDGWFVRTGASDDPEAGLSAFAVEMNDVKIALRDATDKSLLLIDELGKGTESQAGHAIAASILEHLRDRQIRAIFATHWHEIFTNQEVNLEGIRLLKMHCEDNVPTYLVKDGVDLNSAAFYSAKKIGIDEKIIKRAQEIAGFDFGNSAKTQEEVDDKATALKEIIAKVAKVESRQIKNLQANEMPPLCDLEGSVLYVLRTKNNFFYVGETDNFLYRIMAHRGGDLKAKCQFFYIKIKEGKSKARQIEQELISKLQNCDFPMISINDARNSNFANLE